QLVEWAPELLRQGRRDLLRATINQIKPQLEGAHPWISYWLGMSLLRTHPAEARQQLAQAYSLFLALEDKRGIVLAATAVLDTHVLEWDRPGAMVQWCYI